MAFPQAFMDELFLQLPMVSLCKPDCKGLCEARAKRYCKTPVYDAVLTNFLAHITMKSEGSPTVPHSEGGDQR